MGKFIYLLMICMAIVVVSPISASAENSTKLRVTQDFCEAWGDSITEPFSCYSVENQGTIQHFISEYIIVLHPAGAIITGIGQEKPFIDLAADIALKPFKIAKITEVSRRGNLYLQTLEEIQKTDNSRLRELLADSLDSQVAKSKQLVSVIDKMEKTSENAKHIETITKGLSEIEHDLDAGETQEDIVQEMLHYAIKGSTLDGKLMTIPFEGSYFYPDKSQEINVEFLDKLIDDFNNEVTNQDYESKYAADFFFFMYKMNKDLEDDMTYDEMIVYLKQVEELERIQQEIVAEGEKLLEQAHRLNESPETHADAMVIYEFILENKDIFTPWMIDEALAGMNPAEFFLELAKTSYNKAMNNAQYPQLKVSYLQDALTYITSSLRYSQTSEQYYYERLIKLELLLSENKCSSASVLAKELKDQYPGSEDTYHERMKVISNKFKSNTCVIEPLTNTGTLYKLWESPYSGNLRALGPDNNLYFTSLDNLSVFDKQTKSELAKLPLGLSDAYSGGHYIASVTVGQNRKVYVGLNNKIKSYDADLSNEQILPIEGVASPITVGENGKLYLTTNTGMLYETNHDFSEVKSYRIAYNSKVTSPTIGPDGTIYVGVSDMLYAIKPDLSGEKWESIDIGNINYFYTDGISTPVIGKDGIVYVASDNALVAVSADGNVIGQISVAGDWNVSRPTIASDGTVYTTISPWSTNHYIAAFSSDLKYMENRYEFERLDFWSSISEPVLNRNDHLIITEAHNLLPKYNKLYYINPKEHSEKTYTTDSVMSLPYFFEENETFYVTKSSGGFEALSVTPGEIDTSAPIIEGIEDITIQLNEAFDSKHNVSATDNIDGDLTDSIVVEGTVDTTLQGKYVLTYKVVDYSGNETVETRNVIVRDSSAPTIEGIEDITIQQNEEFNSLHNVSATDNIDGDLTNSIVVEGTVDTTQVGTYVLTYKVVDYSGNETVETRNVIVVDSIAPIIAGIEDITIQQNKEFNALHNVSATDHIDGDLTNSIIIEGTVDTTQVGTYVLTYKVVDHSGNETVETRNVIVVDSSAPTIEGIEDITIQQNGEFNALHNVSATDHVDGDLTDSIVIEGTVDTTQVGTYVLTYKVVDYSGNETSVTRNITVKNMVAPTKPSVNEVNTISSYVTGVTNANKTVVVKIGLTELGRATANTEGNYSVAIEPQEAGTTLVVTVVDEEGNESEGTETTVKQAGDVTDGQQPIDECFIATAAFGSKFTPAVELLRDFRDEFLLTNSIGQKFVDFYYENSPPIAQFIANNEFLKFAVRSLLAPIVGVVYLLFHPALLGLLVLLMGILVMKIRNKRLKVSKA